MLDVAVSVRLVGEDWDPERGFVGGEPRVA